MRNLNKKANVVAAVIVVVVVVALGVILMNVSVNEEPEVNEQPRVATEADNALKMAMEVGIQEWLHNGFSDKNKVQYCNYPVPPGLDEAKQSLKSLIESNIDEAVSNLRDQNPDYYIEEEIEVLLDVPADLESLENKGVLSLDSDNAKVGLDKENLESFEDISKLYDWEWPVWQMYYHIYKWHEDDSGNLHDHMRDLAFRATGCQIVSADCMCENATFPPAIVQSIELTDQDVRNALDASLAELNQRFEDAGLSVVCSYKIDKLRVENKKKINWTAAAVANKGITVVPLDETHYNANEPYGEYKMYQYSDPVTVPSTGCPNTPGNPAQERPEIEVQQELEAEYIGEETETTCSGELVEFTNEVEGELGQAMKVGYLAINKYASFIATFTCEDPSISVEGKNDLENLNAEFEVSFSAMQDCPSPMNPLDWADDATTCPGGSCFPAGTEISMADGSRKSIEDVKVGDMVIGYNIDTGEFREAEVLQLESPVREGLYTIGFEDGSTIQVTNEHPFYVKKADGKETWASIVPEETYKETKSIDDVASLEEGDRILREDKTWLLVEDISYTDGTVKTYNLREVSGYDNFYADGLLVHNKCCFTAGTPVTMSDGTTMPIENVKIGDMVMTYNIATGDYEPAEVLDLQKPIREGVYVLKFKSGKELELTNDHPMYTRKASGETGWAAVEVDAAQRGYKLDSILQLEVSDSIMVEGGAFDEIVSIEYKKGDVQTYTLKKVEKNKNFFANGYLAHNQKRIGYVGLACPISCDTCYGCQYSGGDPQQASSWECVGPFVNFVCGSDTECEVCDANGNCVADSGGVMNGLPCGTDGTECDVCVNGACETNPPEAATGIAGNGILCSVAGGADPCTRCNGLGPGTYDEMCTLTVATESACNEDVTGMTEREKADQNCKICSPSTAGACVADPDQVGTECGMCAQCAADGTCSQGIPGSRDYCVTDDKPCMQCADDPFQCAVNAGLDSVCGACKRCAGDGSCEADPDQNGDSCGECKVCQDGSCVGDSSQNGNPCGSPTGGCTATCQDGSCRGTEGAPCNLDNECGIPGECSSSGKCSATTEYKDKICCGADLICDKEEGCCKVGGFQCGTCPPPK